MPKKKIKFGLTGPQQEVYNFLIAFHQVNSIFPTYAQIMRGKLMDDNGMETQYIKERKSKSNIWRIMHELRERGWIDFQESKKQSTIIL
tara:strand:+ start:920 stop:1186 length:267 start_codon:yes stop_codon:yes gene_type:complete